MYVLELGCWASAIIYRKTRVYGDYQWIIAINASTRPLTLRPIATPSTYVSAGSHVSPKFGQNAKFTTFLKVNLDREMSTKLWNLNFWKRKRQHSQTWNLSNILHQRDSQSFSILPKKTRKSQHFWRTIENWVCFTIYFQQFISFCAFIYSNTNSHQ